MKFSHSKSQKIFKLIENCECRRGRAYIPIDRIEELLKKSIFNFREPGAPADPNACSRNLPMTQSLLRLAAVYKCPQTVRLLIAYGADLFLNEEETGTVMYNALRPTSLTLSCELIRFLLNEGVDINMQLDREGTTPLHAVLGISDGAIADWDGFKARARLEVVRLLLDSGADVNAKTSDGTSVLTAACEWSRDYELIDMLLKAGADKSINEPNDNGWTPLHSLLNHKYYNGEGDVRILNRLITLGAEVNCFGSDSTDQFYKDRTPLHLAAHPKISFEQLPVPETVRVLVKSGARVNAQDGRKRSALHHALCHKNAECIQFLIDSGANLNMQSDRGQTPLYEFVDSVPVLENFEVRLIINILLDAGTDCSIKDNEGNTVLDQIDSNPSNKSMQDEQAIDLYNKIKSLSST